MIWCRKRYNILQHSKQFKNYIVHVRFHAVVIFKYVEFEPSLEFRYDKQQFNNDTHGM